MSRAVAGAIVGLVGVLALPASPAAAHAGLSSSNPKDGATVQNLPGEVVLEFTEPVGEPEVEVTASDGTVVSDGDPEALGATVTEPLATDGPSGTYTIAYRVVSADGHPVSDELTFDVRGGPPPGDSVDTASSGDSSDEGFLGSHVAHFAIAGAGLLVGVALVGLGLRARS
ncbi:MAG TPA: copper resistance CopC family protein [Nocardioidaceae bacterium]|nr:copper resistance CopC family protein [Nocardioidaceae bacterium]